MENSFTDIISILFANMNSQSDGIDLVARKTLTEISETNSNLIFDSGVKSLSSLLDEDLNDNNTQRNYDNIYNIVELFHDIFTKNKSVISVTNFNVISHFISERIAKIKYTSKDKIKQYKTQLSMIMKIYTYSSSLFFDNVINDLLFMIPPGNLPDRLIIESLIDIAREFPTQSSRRFSDVISRLLPLLGSVVNDIGRVNFSTLFSVLSEAVIVEDDNSEIKAALSSLYATAYEIVTAKWISSVDVKNRSTIIATAMLMASLLSDEAIGNNIDDLCAMFSNNVSKGNDEDNAKISKAFRIFIETNIQKYKERFSSNVDGIISSITEILNDVNISPNVVKYNENFISVKSELLKILYVLFNEYNDKVFSFLISKLESFFIIDKISSAYIIKTMMLRANAINKNKIDLLLSTISKLSHDNDVELKFVLFDIIFTLFDKKFVDASSGVALIEFIVSESGYSDEDVSKKSNEHYEYYTTMKSLRDKAEFILIDMIKKIEGGYEILYPRIYELICSEHKKKESEVIMCDVINTICEKEKKLCLDYEKFSFLPSIEKLIVRMMTMLGEPIKREKMKNVMFTAFKNTICIIHNTLTHRGDKIYINNNIDTSTAESYLLNAKHFSYITYHDSLTSIWDNLIIDNTSNAILTNILNEIITMLNHSISVKDNNTGLLMRMTGIILSKITQRDVIKTNLDNIFSLVHSEYKNEKVNGDIDPSSIDFALRCGVAEAFGFGSRNNIDVVIDKVNSMFKSEVTVKPVTGFASFFMSAKAPELSDEIVSSLIAIIGSIAFHSKPETLRSRIKSNFTSHLDTYLDIDKGKKKIDSNSSMKLIVLQSYGKIFKALQKLSSSYIDEGDIYYLKKRDDYLASMISIYKAEKTINNIKIEAMRNISLLIALDPPISLEQCSDMLSMGFSVFDNDYKNIDDSIVDDLIDVGVNIFESLLSHESHSVVNTEGIDKVITFDSDKEFSYTYLIAYKKESLSQWEIFSFVIENLLKRYLSNDTMRECIANRVNMFINAKKSVKVNQDENEINNWCVIVISLLIFAFDERNSDAQSASLSIIRMLTGIDAYDIENDNDEMFIISFSKLIKNSLKKENYIFFLKKVFSILKHNINTVSTKGALLITQLILNANDYLSSSSISIVDDFISTLDTILTYHPDIDILHPPSSLSYLISIISSLSKINLDVLLSSLLNESYGLTFSPTATLITLNLCDDKATISKVFTKITDIINNSDPGISERPNITVSRSTVILGTMLSSNTATITPLIKKFIPQLLSTLLLRIGSVHSISYTVDQFKSKEEDPRNQTVWAMQKLMDYCTQEELKSSLGSDGSIVKKIMNTNEYDEGVYELMMIFCKVSSYDDMKAMFDFLSGFIERRYKGQRAIVASCFAQFINYASSYYIKDEDEDVINEWRSELLSAMENMMMDSDDIVRKNAIRGIGNLIQNYLSIDVDIDNFIERIKSTDTVDKEKFRINLKEKILLSFYDVNILNMLIDKMSDVSECVVIESINSLQQIILYISVETLSNVLVNLFIKLRPCFDHGNFNIRSMSFVLFSRIITSSENAKNLYDIVIEQIHFNFVSLLLHANDDNIIVSNSAMKSMILAIKAISHKDLKQISIKTDDEYIAVMKEVCDIIVDIDEDKIMFHIQNCIEHSLSSQTNIKANSAMAIALIYTAMLTKQSKFLSSINIQSIIANYVKLLNDYSAKVKVSAMKALTYFKHINI